MPVLVIDNLRDLLPLVGHEVVVSDWLPVTQADIDAFARVTRDVQWIHIDPERAARESPYGTTIAHGFLTLALVSHLHGSSLEVRGCRRIINYGLDRVRFPAPVPTGSLVRCRSVLVKCAEQSEFMHLTWRVTVEVKDQSKPALVADWLVRMYRD